MSVQTINAKTLMSQDKGSCPKNVNRYAIRDLHKNVGLFLKPNYMSNRILAKISQMVITMRLPEETLAGQNHLFCRYQLL